MIESQTNFVNDTGYSESVSSKKSYIMAIVFILFVIFWLPSVIMQFVFTVHGVTEVSKTTFAGTVILLYANSAVNPVIYGIFSPKFRSAYKRTVFCKRCQEKSLQTTNLP